jgi:hypothetical protein
VARARRRARTVVGAKPANKLLVKRGKAGLKEGLETAVVAAAGGAALKVAANAGRKVTEKGNSEEALALGGEGFRLFSGLVIVQ